ncbi:unnamed protein product [Cuscuta campestris]|uniref:Uncharacterized protein n=1 Tax=Cuscuta campestris TaxID=132261 RepID=A0A484N5X0_9ASTE|nr:unnamed protein product [Cuscuta campestris]
MEHLSLQLQGHTSPSAQSSPFQSQQKEVTAAPKITSKDQTCISSESESHGKHLSAQINPMFLVGNPDLSLNPSHGEMNQSMIHSPYNYSDPYYSGLFAAYGPQPFVSSVCFFFHVLHCCFANEFLRFSLLCFHIITLSLFIATMPF